MKVSIAVPIYNVEKYIERCLRSIMSQTYKGELECILVDDASSDGTLRLCEGLIEAYEGPIEFKLIRQPKNCGVSATRNACIRASEGEYIYFLDSDDEIAPSCIETLMKLTESHPGVQMVIGMFRSWPYNPIYEIDLPGQSGFIDDRNLIRVLSLPYIRRVNINVTNKLIRRDFIEENSLFFKEGIIHEDDLWSYFAMRKLRSLAYTHEETYLRYSVENSIMTSSTKAKSGHYYGLNTIDILNAIDEPFYGLQLFCYSWFALFFLHVARKDAVYADLSKLIRRQAKRGGYGLFAFLTAVVWQLRWFPWNLPARAVNSLYVAPKIKRLLKDTGTNN